VPSMDKRGSVANAATPLLPTKNKSGIVPRMSILGKVMNAFTRPEDKDEGSQEYNEMEAAAAKGTVRTAAEREHAAAGAVR
jgi:flagellar biosynthesis/type III secretory pathway ATPase